MAHTKQVKAAAVLNNAFDSSVTGGDGKELCATDHPLINGGTFANEPSTAADLNETSLEDALISIAGFVDERGLKIALRGTKLIIPRQLQFTAERLMSSVLRPATSDNDVNAIRSMGMLPQVLSTNMEADFDTGNMRYKARERYSFGFSDPRCVFGSPGA
jgi:hypothetical protein